MIIFNRFIPFVIFAVVIFVLEMIMKQPSFVFWGGGILLFGIIMGVASLVHFSSLRPTIHFLFGRLAGFLSLYALSAFMFFILLESVVMTHIFIIFLALTIYMVLENIYIYLYEPLKYQAYSLENIFTFVSVVASFLIFVTFYSVNILLGWSLWLLMFVAFSLTALLTSHIFWTASLSVKKSIKSVFIIALLVAELFWVMSFLPVHFYVSSFVLSVMYFLMITLTKLYLQENWHRLIVRWYVIVSAIALLVVLLTTRWT